jgi:hypothetical protein
MSITITDEMVKACGKAALDLMATGLPLNRENSGMYVRAALSAVAPLIEAAVRERCAKVADNYRDQWSSAGGFGGHSAASRIIAAAIRADGGAE